MYHYARLVHRIEIKTFTANLKQLAQHVIQAVADTYLQKIFF